MLKNHGNESQQITVKEKLQLSSTKGHGLAQIIYFIFDLRLLLCLVRIQHHQIVEVDIEQMEGTKNGFDAKFITVSKL